LRSQHLVVAGPQKFSVPPVGEISFGQFGTPLRAGESIKIRLTVGRK
jgi:hypothetical protein